MTSQGRVVSSGGYRIPFTRPMLDARDADALAAVIASGWIATGERTRRLESLFAARIGRRFGVACHSGAAALTLAMDALHIGPGDEVIVPSLTFTATAAAVAERGARVVFGDITSEGNLTLSAESVAAMITPRTRAVVFVPYGGYAGSLLEVAWVCRDAGIPLVEDACHAPGATVGDSAVGAIGALSTYSFHSTKNITSGEGGMVLFDNEDYLAPMHMARSHGIYRVDDMTGDGADYVVERAGANHRMSDLTAALALAQLERLEEYNRARVRLSCRYDELLSGRKDLRRPFAAVRRQGVGHLYPVLLPPGADRRSVRMFLRKRGIETAVHYVPLHRQPAYRGHARTVSVEVTERAAPRLMSLPLYPDLTDALQRQVVEVLCAAVPDTATLSSRPSPKSEVATVCPCA